MMRCSLRAPFRSATLREFSVYYGAIAADKQGVKFTRSRDRGRTVDFDVPD
jgi:hypothetical protein